MCGRPDNAIGDVLDEFIFHFMVTYGCCFRPFPGFASVRRVALVRWISEDADRLSNSRIQMDCPEGGAAEEIRSMKIRRSPDCLSGPGS